MKKVIVSLLLGATLLPISVWSAELSGTVVKLDKTKNQIVMKTERGQETLEIVKETKGVEHAKEGSKVMLRFSEKDGAAKVSEIVPATNP
jgi:hypothetical protein